MNRFFKMAAFVTACAASMNAGVIVYSNNFSGGAGSDFSNTTVSTTPGTVSHAADAFLGDFGNSTEAFSLGGLATHATVTLTFDLYIIRSMDGNGQFGGGPDNWYLFLPDTSTDLLSTNFANYPGNTQAYPGNVAPLGTGANNAPGTGATEINTLGYTFNGTPMDSVYHITETFASSASTLNVDFESAQSEDISNESWGLDNVTVSTDADLFTSAPEPATFGMFGAGLGVLAFVRRRAKKA